MGSRTCASQGTLGQLVQFNPSQDQSSLLIYWQHAVFGQSVNCTGSISDHPRRSQAHLGVGPQSLCPTLLLLLWGAGLPLCSLGRQFVMLWGNCWQWQTRLWLLLSPLPGVSQCYEFPCFFYASLKLMPSLFWKSPYNSPLLFNPVNDHLPV